MRRLGPAPFDFATPIIRRTIDHRASGIRQIDLAHALGCDESRISHIKAGRQLLGPHEIPVFCATYGTYELAAAIAGECDLDVVERSPSRTVQPSTLHALMAMAMRDVGAVAVKLDEILANGQVDPHEEVDVDTIDATVVAIIETARAVRARLPRLPRARGGAS
jgi:hypothetical protein